MQINKEIIKNLIEAQSKSNPTDSLSSALKQMQQENQNLYASLEKAHWMKNMKKDAGNKESQAYSQQNNAFGDDFNSSQRTTQKGND